MHSRIVCLSLAVVLAIGCDAPVGPERDPADPNPIQDGDIDKLPTVESSMAVHCVPGTACARLRFVVDVAGMATKVNVVSLINPSMGKWIWGDAIAVLDANGNPTGFGTSTVGGVAQVFLAFGAPAVEPLTVIMDATGSTGTQADLGEAFSYVGTAIAEKDGTYTAYEFNGKVVKSGS